MQTHHGLARRQPAVPRHHRDDLDGQRLPPARFRHITRRKRRHDLVINRGDVSVSAAHRARRAERQRREQNFIATEQQVETPVLEIQALRVAH